MAQTVIIKTMMVVYENQTTATGPDSENQIERTWGSNHTEGRFQKSIRHLYEHEFAKCSTKLSV